MSANSTLIERNNIRRCGSGRKTLLLAHGFGCDQNMWRFLVPLLERDFQLVLFDYVGWGGSSLEAYDEKRYSTLTGYAQDIVQICDGLNLNDVTIVGHSVSAMIGLLASIYRPERFSSHVMVCPSPCFLNDPPDYHGGFERQDIADLFDLLDKNYIGWAEYLAPLAIGQSGDSELTRELAESFCSTDPVIARNFAHATFYSDLRAELPRARHPCLLLQSQSDFLASVAVGEYMHNRMPASELRILESEGHCLHMTHPKTVAEEIRKFMETQSG